MTESKLYRSRSNSMIGGVCGGLGHYLNVDPIVFRILFVLALIVGGSGFLVYVILWIVIPVDVEQVINTNQSKNETMTDETKTTETHQESEPIKKPEKNDGNLWGGLILITLGGIFLIDRFVPRIDFGDLWPVILIVVGVILISKSYQQPKN
ncbi:MAG: PspC domain-containing protein [Bacteroidales bacterium]|nr:PspC domain-containing protein [Bacteroidales bacterium]MCF8403210.1 PspC domain-containing protein [Bacteroidales bacterium]